MPRNFKDAWAEQFSGSPAATLGQVAVGLILGGKAWYEWTEQGATPTDVFVWMCALTAYLLGVFIYHAWAAWNKERDQREAAEASLRAIRDAAPRLVFEQAARAHPVTLGGAGAGHQVGVWQLWFRNRPAIHTPDATARHVTAKITFYDASWSEIALEFIGQWAISLQPEHVGWEDMRPAIDIPAGHSWAKLQLVAESGVTGLHIDNGVERTVRHVYGLSGENMHERPLSADHLPYILQPNAERLRVKLIATNMEPCVFKFNVERTEDSSIRSISPIQL